MVNCSLLNMYVNIVGVKKVHNNNMYERKQLCLYIFSIILFWLRCFKEKIKYYLVICS